MKLTGFLAHYLVRYWRWAILALVSTGLYAATTLLVYLAVFAVFGWFFVAPHADTSVTETNGDYVVQMGPDTAGGLWGLKVMSNPVPAGSTPRRPANGPRCSCS